MTPAPPPRWFVSLSRAMRDSHELLMLVSLAVAGALFALMAAGMLAAHVAGRF